MSDQDLTVFPTYEDYLDSFIRARDRRYLKSKQHCRKLVQSACSSSCIGEILTAKKFRRIQRKQLSKGRFEIRVLELFSDHMLPTEDEVMLQFAKREKLLGLKKLSCIVFLVMRSKAGFEVSGYIDLASSFLNSRLDIHDEINDWFRIFQNKDRLRPSKSDLSYCDWKNKLIVYNDSDNFRHIFEGDHSLLYMDRGDYNIICVNGGCDCKYSKNAVRSMYYSNIYGHVLFFDHIIKRIH